METALTCWRRCRSLLWWFRAWTQRGWSHPASLCLFSLHPCLPTPTTHRIMGDEVKLFSERYKFPTTSCGCSFSTTAEQVSVHVRFNSCVWQSAVSYHGNHGTRAHVVDESREEWSVLQVDVVLPQEVIRGLQRRDTVINTFRMWTLLYN